MKRESRIAWRGARGVGIWTLLASLAVVVALSAAPAPARATPRSRGPQARVERSWLGRKRLVIGETKIPLTSKAARLIEQALLSPDTRGRLVKTLQALRAHDQHTFEHSRRVGAYARLLASQLGFGVAREVGLAGVLHDVGKLGVSRGLLRGKRPRLSKRQLAEIRRHPAYGATLLEALGADLQSVRGALSHHERLDGGGYPHALAGEKVPTIGRILAVVDAFDAMTSARSYNKPMTKAQAVARLRELSGGTLDSNVVETFVRSLETPAGRAIFATSQRGAKRTRAKSTRP